MVMNKCSIDKLTLNYNGHDLSSLFDVDNVEELLKMLDKQYVDDTKGNKQQRYYNSDGKIELQTRENGSKIEPFIYFNELADGRLTCFNICIFFYSLNIIFR